MTLIIILLVVFVRILVAIAPAIRGQVQILFQAIRQLMRKRKLVGLFDEYFIEPKAFYFHQFKKVPSIAYIGNIDAVNVFKLIEANKYGTVKEVYQRNFYNWQQSRIEFSKTLFVIDGYMMIRMGDDWAEILHSNNDFKSTEERR
jgi:hypothetical protein